MPADAPSAVEDVDLGHLGRALRKRARWIVLPTLLACFATALIVGVITPRYTAETRILLENGENFYTQPGNGSAPQSQIDDEAVQSQVQVIMSRDLAREAISKLGLAGNPEFDPVVRGVGPLKRVLVMLGLQRNPADRAPEERVLEAYYSRLLVYQVGKSRVVAIEFTSEDPDLAARAATTIAELYLAFQQSAKQATARSASTWLASTIEPLRKRVAEAEAKVEEFRASKGLLLGNNNAPLPSQQLADLSAQLASTRTAQSDAQAKAKMIRDMLGSGSLLDIPDVANNDLVRRLIEQRVNLQAQLALESRALLPEHPRIKELKAQLDDLDVQIRSAAERTARALEADSRLAGSRVESLLAAIEAQKELAAAAREDEVRLRALELDARTEREQLESYLAKYREAQVRDSKSASPADARIVSRAVVPATPSFPKKVPIIIVVTLATLVLSTAVVVSMELFSGRAFVSSGPDAASRTRADGKDEAHSLIPLYQTLDNPEIEDIDAFEVPPALRSSGAFDVILAKLAIPPEAGRGRRVLVAESGQSYGAADVARNLARYLSQRSRTVLLMLAPEAHEVADPSFREPGFTDLISGEASFAAIIGREAGSRLHVIASGTRPRAALDGADETIELALAALEQTYEWVLCVLPGVPDTGMGIFARSTQGAILVAREGEDDGRTLEGYQTLERLGARNIVVALVGDERQLSVQAA